MCRNSEAEAGKWDQEAAEGSPTTSPTPSCCWCFAVFASLRLVLGARVSDLFWSLISTSSCFLKNSRIFLDLPIEAYTEPAS